MAICLLEVCENLPLSMSFVLTAATQSLYLKLPGFVGLRDFVWNINAILQEQIKSRKCQLYQLRMSKDQLINSINSYRFLRGLQKVFKTRKEVFRWIDYQQVHVSSDRNVILKTSSYFNIRRVAIDWRFPGKHGICREGRGILIHELVLILQQVGIQPFKISLHVYTTP